MKRQLAALSLVLAASVATNVNAAEVSVQRYVTHLVSSALEITRSEIQYGLQESILNAGHNLSIESQPVKAKITVKDLASNSQANTATNQKAE